MSGAAVVSDGAHLVVVIGFCMKSVVLKVHKREKFFGSDFEFFTIL